MARQSIVFGVGAYSPIFVNEGQTRQNIIGAAVFENERSGSAAPYSLSCAVGSFSITGVAAGLKAARKIACVTGSFLINGNSATLTWSGAPVSTGLGGGGGFGRMGGGFGRMGGRSGAPFSSGAPSSMSLTAITAGRVYQRTKSLTTGPVPISGTYGGGTPTGIEAQCLESADNSVVVDWTALTAPTIGGSSWSGSLPGVPNGGGYYVKVRCANATSVTATGGTSFYIGDWFICYGQSFMNGICQASTGSPPAAAAGTGWFDGSIFTTVPSADGIRRILNGYKTKTGIPCAAFNAAVNGTPLANLIQGDPIGNFNNLAAQLSAIGSDAAYVLWFQGSSDANSLTPVANYVSDIKHGLHDPICTLTGRTTTQLPFILCGLATVAGAPYTDVGWANIQSALEISADIWPNIYYSHSTQDLPLADGLHMTAAGYATCGDRFAQTAAYLQGSEAHPASWFATSASIVDATHTTVTLSLGLGTDFTPTSGLTGWEISDDDGGTWNSCTGARASVSTITLTHASIGNTRLIRYMYGIEPDISSIVKDNSSLALPLATTGKNNILTVTPGATPVVAKAAGGASSAATSQTITLPTNISKGDLVYIQICCYDQDMTFPSGWTQLTSTTTSGGLRTKTVYRICDGSEVSLIVSLSGSSRVGYRSLRIIGQKSTGAIESSTPVSGSGSSSDSALLSPSWGSANNLWIAGCLARSGGSTTLISGYPSGYSDNQVESTSNNLFGASATISTKAAASSSDDPGAFTLVGARENVAVAAVIRPV